MKKKNIIVGIIFIVLIMLTCFFMIDYNLAKLDKDPIFMLKVNENEEAEYYLGLGYKFVRGKESFIEDDIRSIKSMEFGLWIYSWNIDVEIFYLVVQSDVLYE